MITGATGTLGRAFVGACNLRDIPYVLTDRARLPLNDFESISRLLGEVHPWAVINAAGWVRVDDAETNPQACLRANRDGAINLARACGERGISFTTFSSDLVFDGHVGRPYVEADAPAPLNTYGRSKAEADGELLSWDAAILVIRTAAFFSPYDPHNFAMQLVDSLRNRKTFRAATSSISPTFVPDLVRTTLDLMIDGETGLWHVVNDGAGTWAEFGREIARATGLDPFLVQDTPASAMGWCALRPAAAQMRTTRGQLMPSLDHAITRFASSICN